MGGEISETGNILAGNAAVETKDRGDEYPAVQPCRAAYSLAAEGCFSICE